ncbi:MAG: homoserine dehydrogenase [Deltaproteobacteria bacterium]|nr:homoserine dehydrogenase [Deltaproteobacteria bacterium]
MKDKKIIRIGLAGFGTVGSGLATIIAENRDWIAHRIGKELVIPSILVRDLCKKRDNIPHPETVFTDDPLAFVDNPDIDIFVELIGGTTVARNLILSALDHGRPVVTANKALLAEHGAELFIRAAEKGVGLYYEASVAGGIPIVQTLKESLAGNRIRTLTGILNGTANYILTEMTSRGISFEQALTQSQEKGYAEADPTLDISGMDAAHKLVLLIRLAHGQDFPLSKLSVQGIDRVQAEDIRLASEFGYRIKLLGQVRERSGHLQAGVFPALLRADHMLAKVDGPFNSILLEGNAVGPIMLYGQGAGDLPTGSAVLADIMALARDGSIPNNTGFVDPVLPPVKVLDLELTTSRHYFRLGVEDKPGVLSAVAGVMADKDISIAQVVQRQDPARNDASVVFITHAAQMRQVGQALDEIDRMPFITQPSVHYRIL